MKAGDFPGFFRKNIKKSKKIIVDIKKSIIFASDLIIKRAGPILGELKKVKKMKHYAIFISTWNKDDIRLFDTIEEAQKEWERICNNKYAIKTDGGKNIIHSNPKLGYLSNLYYKTRYQASWL